MAGLDKWEKRQLEAGFHLLDLNKDGRIVKSELQQGLKACGFNYTDEEVADMIRVADASGKHSKDGHVDLRTFLGLFPHQTTDESEAEIKEAFKHLTKGESELTKSDLLKIFEDIGEKATEEEVEELISLCFAENGVIEVKYFHSMCVDDEP